MKMLQKGDKCPMCGRPIKTDDPNKLIVLSSINWIMEQRGGGDVCEDGYIGRTDCEKGSTGSTNADKLRSLPDEELLYMIYCPWEEDPKPWCKADCEDCMKKWIKAPYSGWYEQEKS